MPYRRLRTLAGKGSDPERFRSALRGIALDARGRLFAAGDREVKVFSEEGELIRRWPTAKPGISVAVDSDGKVHVGQAGQVEVFGAEGDRLSVWRDSRRLGLVSAIDFWEDSVFLADARGPAIREFDRRGGWIRSFGDGGRRRGFSVPNGYLDFCIDAGGVIHATNPGKHRVERYSRKGELLGRLGKFGMHDPADFRGCCNPTNVAVSGTGHVAVSEKAAPRTKVYDARGELLAVVADAEDFDPGCKYMDIALNRAGWLFVADSAALQIHVFAETGKASGSAVLERAGHDG